MPQDLPTLQEWYSNMRADARTLMESSQEIPVLSLLNVFLVVFAGAIKLLGDHLNNVATWVLPDQAQGEFLERYLYIYDVAVSSGSAAEGSVVATGTVATSIPAESLLQTIDGVQYRTLVDSIINADGSSNEIPCLCDRLGTIGNYNGSELTFVTPIPNINSTVSVTVPFVGGSEADTETDSRQKLLSAIQNPNTLGLVTDYERIILAEEGVGKIWVQRADYWTGPHTVVVTLATSENEPVGASKVVAIQNLLNTDEYQQPGIIVEVSDLTVTEYTFEISITPDTEGFRNNVTNSLTAFFQDSVDPSETVLISAMRSAVAASGVADYTITKILPADEGGDGPRNITPPTRTKASFGGVTFV